MIIGVDARELEGNPTGAGRYLQRLLEEWGRDSRDRIVAYSRAPVRVPGGCLNHSLAAPGTRGLAWQEIALPAATKRDGIEVFFSPAYSCPLRVRVPRAVAVHDLSFFSWPHDFTVLDGFRRRTLARLSLGRAAALFACSQFTAREIGLRFPALRPRIHFVPLAADASPLSLPDRAAARVRLGLRGPSLLWVGSLFNRRSVSELLLALPRLARRFSGLRLDLVGANRTHPRLDLERLIDGLGLHDSVRLTGFLSDAELACRYAAADLVVYLSDYEGFGLPVMEAMARGVPVVTGDRPSTNEIAGDAARLVDPRDVGAIGAAIDELLRRPEQRARLGAAGLKRAQLFDWRATARRTREILQALVREP
jgi:glycosyltransferase involved in cell wall biosynthesis